MDGQPAAVYVVSLVTQQVEKLGVDHAGEKIEGVVGIGNDDEQGSFPVPKGVQFQLIICRQFPQFLDIEGG